MARAATGATADEKFCLDTDIGVAQGEWLKFPSSVHAPSPIDRNVLCRLRISHNDTSKAARAGRRSTCLRFMEHHPWKSAARARSWRSKCFDSRRSNLDSGGPRLLSRNSTSVVGG